MQQLRGGPLSEPMPLMKLKLDGEHLLFEFKEDDDPDSTHWRMDLIDARRANLQWIETPLSVRGSAFSFDEGDPGTCKKSSN